MLAKHLIHHADIKEWAKNYDGELFDAVLCDPPYELGFMGKGWDSSGIAFDVEMWRNIYNHLKPGGHLLAFSGSRTYHRMAVAIEDAGFEIRDMIEWVYGSGFPKSLNIGKAVDKIQGNEREVTGSITRSKSDMRGKDNYLRQDKPDITTEYTKGNSPYEGYGTALKPAHEPCVLARKPIEGTVANNVLKHGTGGLNIDGSRVEGNAGHGTAGRKKFEGFNKSDGFMGEDFYRQKSPPNPQGRFPANIIHDGSDEVEAVFPQSKSTGGVNTNGNNGRLRMGATSGQGSNAGGLGDSGSASRFFYTAKSSRAERNLGLDEPNTHPTLKPLSLTKYLATLIKPPTGGRLLVPFSGSGSEMIGGLQAGWEYVEGVELTEEYIPIAEARIKYWLSQVEEEDKQETLL